MARLARSLITAQRRRRSVSLWHLRQRPDGCWNKFSMTGVNRGTPAFAAAKRCPVLREAPPMPNGG